MEDIDLNDADRQILGELTTGRNVPANLADELGYSRQYIQNRIQRLREHGLVNNVGRGVYELTDNGRNRYDS